MYDQEIQSVKQRFGIIGNSPKLNHAIQVAVQVASTDLTVLITGENGSGKESFSKIIHQLGQRKHGQFIAINCGAIPEGTIDSELFGHEKGAFTGAQEARKGYFEVTNGGTIFLDEIGEMPLKTQTRLLRVLENKEFIRVGSSKVQKTDVRVVAATNRDLMEQVEKGKFREDLYYRLNTVPIIVPPLRERENDILLLFRKFASDFAERYRVKPIMLTDEAKEIVLNFRFPGNIRQLKNLVEQVSVLEIDRNIDATTISKYLPSESRRMMPALVPNKEEDKGLNERDLLYKVLFDMRKDMTELKKMVLQMAQEGGQAAPQLIKDNHHLFNDIETDDAYDSNHLIEEVPTVQPTTPSLPSTYMIQPSEERIEPRKAVDYDKVEDIIHETEDESFSLQKQEKEMIVKALRKNNNKRKYAARDLGISERTLYRKIKQYEIED
ncbi:sigma-54 interaction domain-containing protein [Sediminitomix flava]|uniref:Transcriptional regulator n=1 Tax=Sediminitomix flava TaxID=379075 RepID=A0A315ZI15_SEDFL|nr:sigma-54 dependent transcriptional regulator [Sediminitomix flava]PWJ44458.1 transcriptional regulator [Sediminitomix flava]